MAYFAVAPPRRPEAGVRYRTGEALASGTEGQPLPRAQESRHLSREPKAVGFAVNLCERWRVPRALVGDQATNPPRLAEACRGTRPGGRSGS